MNTTATTPGTGHAQALPGQKTNELRRGAGAMWGGIFYWAGSPIIIVQTQSILIAPQMEETGLPATAVTIAPWLLLVMGLLQPVVGWLLKKYSPRPLLLAALIGNAVGLAAFAILPASWASFWIIAIGIGVFGALGYWASISRMLSFWFRKNLGLVTGIVGGAASLLPLAMIPVLSYFIYNGGGWRSAYWTLFAYVVAISIPMTVLLFKKPRTPLFADDAALQNSDRSPAADKRLVGLTVPEILRTGRFWFLLVSQAIVTIAVGGFLANIAAIAIDRGFDPIVATGMAMAILVGVLGGRVLGGFLLDRVWSYASPILMFLLSGIGALTVGFAPTTSPVLLVWIAATLVGLSQGAEGDYMSYFALREFGAANFPFANGLVLAVNGVMTFIGGFAFAIAFDLTGSYSSVTGIVALAYFVAAVLMGAAGLISLRAHRNGALYYAGRGAAINLSH